jgi:hypothetical protein
MPGFRSILVDSLSEPLYNPRIGKECLIMAKKKEPMGFRTSAKQLEQTLKEIQEQLSKKKADWGYIAGAMKDLYVKLTQSIDPDKASADEVIGVFSVLLASMVASLGVELTETHDRLAKVERAIKELKLGL